MEVVVNELKNSEKKKEEKNVKVPKTLADLQRIKLEKLLKNPDKPVFIPEKRDPKLPRVFNPPEFVRNIWGSSAGAGSGDFHVYRGVRRRENARQKFLDIKSKKDELDEEFQKRLVEHKQQAIERTDKKRAKRLKKKQKAKNAKKQKVNQKANNAEKDDSESESEDDDRNSSSGDCDARSETAQQPTADCLFPVTVNASDSKFNSDENSTNPSDRDDDNSETNNDST